MANDGHALIVPMPQIEAIDAAISSLQAGLQSASETMSPKSARSAER
jgi:hypothetical protein